MKCLFLQHRKQWSAFMTIGGMDYQAYGDTDRDARTNIVDMVLRTPSILETFLNGLQLPEWAKAKT